jgi:hypothetical protein
MELAFFSPRWTSQRLDRVEVLLQIEAQLTGY